MDNCYKTSNNKYFDCPARMSDGRHFTDYRPNCDLEHELRQENNVMSSFEYRNFLQSNAEQILNVNRKKACRQNCCGGSCKENFNNGTMLPEKYIVKCDGNTCTRVLADPTGLGDGRAYFTTPSSCKGLPASYPVDQTNNVCYTMEDRHHYIGDYKVKPQRHSHPSGGNVLEGGDY